MQNLPRRLGWLIALYYELYTLWTYSGLSCILLFNLNEVGLLISVSTKNRTSIKTSI